MYELPMSITFPCFIVKGYTNKKEEKRETVLWAHLETAETNGKYSNIVS